MSHWHLQPVFGSYATVAAVAAILCLLLLIRPSYRAIRPARRAVLAGLRLAVIVLIALALLRPTRTSTTTRPQTAVLIVLFDQSRSMQLPNASGPQSRWAAQRQALERAEPLLRALAEDMEVKIYGYDAGLHAVAFPDDALRLPDAADGAQTDIGSSLHAALQRELGKRLAGIVLMGDGVQTAFEPAVEIQQAGRELARLGYPLHAVPFGPVGDAVQARDVAVQNLQDQYTVFVKNELPLRAAVRVHGYVNRPIPVELLVETPNGLSEKIGPVTVTARQDGQQVAVQMQYVPKQVGRYKLTLRAQEQADELVTKNNHLSAYLRVLEGGLKLLYLEGQLRWEQVFLRRALDASPDMELDFRWIDPRGRERWPVALQEPLSDPDYDAFILGDLDSAALGELNLKLLAEAVEGGKGLALLGGNHSFGPGGYRDTPLADVMPILMDRFERQDFDGAIREDLHLKGPLRMLPTGSHPVTALAAGPQNQAAWQRLPPLSGSNKFVGVKQAAGVRVLAATDDGKPLLVAGEYGRGRVLAMAGDSTWRWWMHGHQAAYKRFWRQAVLWLVRRDAVEQNDVWIKMQRRRFNPGSRVTFTAGANAATGQPIGDATLRAELILPDQTRQPLRLARDGDHWIGSVSSVAAPGDYAIDIVAEKEGNAIGRARGEFLVFDRDIEFANPAADHDLLARLAAMTRDSGGRVVAPEQLPALLQQLRDQPPEMEIEVQTKWQLGDTALDAWLFFLAFVTLLTGEWILRKRWGLV